MHSHSQLQQTWNTDLHAEDVFCYTPIVLAAQAGYKEAFQFMMSDDEIEDVNKNPLFQALKVGDKASAAVKVIIIRQ